MGLFRSLAGTVSAELTSADLAAALRQLEISGIELRNVIQMNSLTLSFDIRRGDVKKLQRIAHRRGDTFRTTAQLGLFWQLKSLLHRPVFLLGVTLLLFMSLTLPSRVLFVKISGNAAVPTRLILEQAAACGIRLGASTRGVRSEDMKNRLLSAVPQLQWAGVNTYGCLAVIDVKERTQEPVQEDLHAVTSILARRDGIILSVVAQQGSVLCKPGDAVVQGQKLISGFTDCGICIRATQAKGEIFALTDRQITLVSPTQYVARQSKQHTEQKYSLIIGKKRINLYKDSGILDGTCARIYSQWYVTLPGGFVLPISIVREEYIRYDLQDTAAADIDLSGIAQRYVLSQTDMGQIISAVETAEELEGLLILHGRYACKENLGITRIEENLDHYGKTS